MSEEQACLVRPRSDSETSAKVGRFGAMSSTMVYTEGPINAEATSAGEPAGDGVAASRGPPPPPPPLEAAENESGELLDYDETSIRSQFHEDAMKQAGFGVYQVRVMLAVCLAMTGAALETAAPPFALPSAEVELCIHHQDTWLVWSWAVGGAVGGAAWGAAAACGGGGGAAGGGGGGRRALLAALAVHALFASVAAFMPTYSTAIVARVCSAAGAVGVVPGAYSYLRDSVPQGALTAAGGALVAGGALAGLYAGGVAAALLPRSAEETVAENKEHFSAWHRYLLVCTVPTLVSLVCLLWTHESPRYLLEAGRDHEAATVYQKIYTSNMAWRAATCDRARARDRPRDYSGSEYRLSELAMPKRRDSRPSLCQSARQLVSARHLRRTLCLGVALAATLALQWVVATHVQGRVRRLESAQFASARRVIDNYGYEHRLYNTTIENVQFIRTTFYNCTFLDMFLSRVAFVECTFIEVTFANIKTSYTTFEDCMFVNSSIIDTDMELKECKLLLTPVRGLQPLCRKDVTSSRLDGVYLQQASLAAAAGLAAIVAVRCPSAFTLSVYCLLLSPSLHFATSEMALYAVEAMYRFFLTLIFYRVSMTIVTTYPYNISVLAHGACLSAASLGAGAGAAAGGALHLAAPATAALAAALAALAAALLYCCR